MIPRWSYFAASLIGLLIAGFVGYGFIAGDGWNEVAALVAMPWGLTTLIDVYAGLLLFCGWVLYRESSLAARVLWCLAVLLGGNAMAALYVVVVLIQSRREASVFWQGRRPA